MREKRGQRWSETSRRRNCRANLFAGRLVVREKTRPLSFVRARIALANGDEWSAIGAVSLPPYTPSPVPIEN
jgi:hypothetical protein